MRKYLPALLLMGAVALLFLSSVSYAEDIKILDTVVAKYNTAAKAWEPVLRQAAKRLFLILCVTSLVFTAGFGFLRGGMGLGDFFAEFLRFGISMGFYYWLLENGPVIAKAIIDSMTTLGQTASSNYLVKLTPSDICTQGFGLIYDAVSEFGKSDYATGILVIVIALMIALVYAVIAAQMIVLLCSSWILIYGGVFYLGFGGGNWTSDIAKNYFKTILAQAMQVFSFCLILGIGQAEIIGLTSGLRTTKTVTVANYWWMFGLGGEPTKQITSETLTMTGMCVALVFALILAILVTRVPGMIAGVINGSSISAMAFGGVGSAVGTARAAMGATTGAIVGAGMMAGQAAGAKMALSSAFSAMRDHKANGEGSFAKGAATSGLRGALHAATDIASNLSSGAGGVLQKTTTGGMMSAHIDGKVQERQAEREKEAAEEALNAMSGGDAIAGGEAGDMSAAESPGDVSFGGLSGAMSAGTGVSDTAASGTMAAHADTVVSGEGAAPSNALDNTTGEGSSSMSDGAKNASAPADEPYTSWPARHNPSASGQAESGSGKRAAGSAAQSQAKRPQATASGQSAFAEVGAFGFDYAEMDDGPDEWNAAIANYDPSKIGLPDG